MHLIVDDISQLVFIDIGLIITIFCEGLKRCCIEYLDPYIHPGVDNSLGSIAPWGH